MRSRPRRTPRTAGSPAARAPTARRSAPPCRRRASAAGTASVQVPSTSPATVPAKVDGRGPVASRHSRPRSSAFGRSSAAQPSSSWSGSCPSGEVEERRVPGRLDQVDGDAQPPGARIDTAGGGEPARRRPSRPRSRRRAKLASSPAPSAGVKRGATGSAWPTSRCSRAGERGVARRARPAPPIPAASSATRASSAARRASTVGEQRRPLHDESSSPTADGTAPGSSKPAKPSMAVAHVASAGGGRARSAATTASRRASARHAPRRRDPRARRRRRRPAPRSRPGAARSRPSRSRARDTSAPERPADARRDRRPTPRPRRARTTGTAPAGRPPVCGPSPHAASTASRRPSPVSSPTGARKTASMAARSTSASVARTVAGDRPPVSGSAKAIAKR